MNDFVFLLAALVLLVIVLAGSVRIVNEDERFAVFTLGRFAGFKGPGLILSPFLINRHHRLKIGDVGVITASAFAKFGDADMPVTVADSLEVGQAIRIDGFNGTEPVIVASTGPSAPIHPPFDEG